MGVLMFKNILFRIFLGFHGIFLLCPVCLTQDFRTSPVSPNIPYLWVSNIPTELCDELHDIQIDMSLFSLSGSPQKRITEQGIVIFYIDKLGYYPLVELETGENVNGGIPQLGCLKKHLDKATTDILYYIVSNKMGLAVIDWAGWRPLWTLNWGLKDIYKSLSVEFILKQNFTLSYGDATNVAQDKFEEAGKNFMLETLRLGKSLRPNYLWGFYLYPDCYNRQFRNPKYNGSCGRLDRKRNDKIRWLWRESTALYPSIYLTTKIRDSQNSAVYVRSLLLEALRVSKVRNEKDPLPVFAYFRPVFVDMPEMFLSKDDLVHTIGESIALGVSGIVMWGGYDITERLEACRNISDYMTNILNPYIINVTLAARMCSKVLCQDQGVCTRKIGYSNDYLHLNPTSIDIQTMKDGKYTIHGKPTINDLKQFSQKFHCSCFSNVNCTTTVDVKTINYTQVCIEGDICIDAFVNSKISDPFKWNK